MKAMAPRVLTSRKTGKIYASLIVSGNVMQEIAKGVPSIYSKNFDCTKDEYNKLSIDFPQKHNVFVRNNAYQYSMHDEPFTRNWLKLKNNMSDAGNKYIKCLENRIGLCLQVQLDELQMFQNEENICDCNRVEKSINSVPQLHHKKIFSVSKICPRNVGGFLNGTGEHTLGESLINVKTEGRI